MAAVRQLAEHYWKSPDQLSDEELRQYFLYLTTLTDPLNQLMADL